jgi:hypothetical protein
MLKMTNPHTAIIARLTDWNDHTAAALEIARHCVTAHPASKELARIELELECIAESVDELGYLPEDMNQKQYFLLRGLLAIVEITFENSADILAAV